MANLSSIPLPWQNYSILKVINKSYFIHLSHQSLVAVHANASVLCPESPGSNSVICIYFSNSHLI